MFWGLVRERHKMFAALQTTKEKTRKNPREKNIKRNQKMQKPANPEF
jgi:hypothetical protein